MLMSAPPRIPMRRRAQHAAHRFLQVAGAYSPFASSSADLDNISPGQLVERTEEIPHLHFSPSPSRLFGGRGRQ